MVLFLPALIGAAGGLIGGLIQGKQSRKNIQSQVSADKELAEYAYGKDLEQWHRQNEYNAPTAQMARLREAGLNPKMIYGTGAASAVGQSGVSPKYQSIKTDFSKRTPMLNPLAVLGAFQDYKLKNAQIDLAESQAARGWEEANWQSQYLEHRNRYMMEKQAGLGRKRYYEEGGTYKRYKNIEGHIVDLATSPGYELYRHSVEARKQMARSTALGADLKSLEKEWLEWMKSAGIGAKIGIPLLRMFIGK